MRLKRQPTEKAGERLNNSNEHIWDIAQWALPHVHAFVAIFTDLFAVFWSVTFVRVSEKEVQYDLTVPENQDAPKNNESRNEVGTRQKKQAGT